MAAGPDGRKHIAIKVIINPEVPVKAMDGTTGVISDFAGRHVSLAVRTGATHDRGKGVSYFTLSVVEGTEVKKGKKVLVRAVRCFACLRFVVCTFCLHFARHWRARH